MSAPATPSPRGKEAEQASREARLAEIVSELTARLQRGEAVDLEEAARVHPDLASELREVWGAVLMAEGMASSRFPREPAAAAGETAPAGSSGAAAPGGLPSIEGYELLEELGRGGMGVVYRSRQLSLGRVVALKVMLGSESGSPESTARFRREAESAARLDHPNIVPVHEVGSSGGRPYFTMSLVEGDTLARVLRDGPLLPREAAALLAPVARAIDYAHRRGVVHRDLKPSNILIGSDGRPQISDFGLARGVESEPGLTLSGAILGTPSYMAPEQAAGSRGQSGPLSDVYSLGAILYHMLTGRPPFQGASAVDTVLSVLEQDPLPPRMVRPGVDRELEMVAMKCLQKPPDLRYPSAGGLAADLEAYLAGETISGRSAGLRLLLNRMLRETHHAVILENWGVLWMWHSLVLLILALSTNLLQRMSVASREPYVLMWTAGLGAWALVFWALRRRRGPITFVERQVAHVWGASIIAGSLLFLVEMGLGLPVLTLSPVLAVVSGMVFFIKAGILSGKFYFQAGALFLTTAAMILFPRIGLTIFGVVNGLCFFLPGWKYHRREARSRS